MSSCSFGHITTPFPMPCSGIYSDSAIRLGRESFLGSSARTQSRPEFICRRRNGVANDYLSLIAKQLSFICSLTPFAFMAEFLFFHICAAVACRNVSYEQSGSQTVAGSQSKLQL